MRLTSPGGMGTPRSSVVLWALLLGGGACSMLLGGCLLPLRTLPKAVQIQPQMRAEQRQHRFQDTLRILAGTMPVPAHKETVAREAPSLDTAVTWCLQSGPSRASSALVAIVESHSERDSIYWEALFQLGECWALNGDYNRASLLLGEIAYLTDGVPPDVHQRALVRLGHVFCMRGQRQTAEQLFERLRRLYPTIPYRALADCRILR